MDCFDGLVTFTSRHLIPPYREVVDVDTLKQQTSDGDTEVARGSLSTIVRGLNHIIVQIDLQAPILEEV